MQLNIKALNSSKRNDFQLQAQDIEIEKGDIVALIGANGSGKTTLVECILGLTKTVQRDISILGQPAIKFDNDAEVRIRIGIQLQKSVFQRGLKVYEIVNMHHLMYRRQSDEIYQLLEMGELSRTNYHKLSRGQRQRVDLFISLAHCPELVFLDEPSTGLDTSFKRLFGQLLEYLRQRGTSILMGSHTLEEIAFCNKVLWVDKGQVKHFGKCQDVVERALGKYRIELSCNTADIHQHVRLKVEGIQSISLIREQGLTLTFFSRNNVFMSLIDSVGAENFTSMVCRQCSYVDLIEQGQGQGKE